MVVGPWDLLFADRGDRKMFEMIGEADDAESSTTELAFAEVEEAVMERLFPALDGIKEYCGTLRDIIRRGDEGLSQVVEDMCKASTRSSASVDGRRAS